MFSEEWSPGAPEERVRLRLGSREIVIAESYEVRQSILTQPSAFSLRLGWGGTARELIARCPPKTPFELLIGDALRASGETDGFEADQSAGATQITIRGRDMLAALHDAFVRADRSFSESTYRDLVQHALREVGLEERQLFASNAANRALMTGIPILAAPGVDEIVEDPTTRGTVLHSVQAKLGERWYQFLRRHLDRAGLFLWARADGHFTLARPSANQKAPYRILRRRGRTRSEINVLNAKLKNETTHRYSEIVVYARGGGRRFARARRQRIDGRAGGVLRASQAG
jgi:prophage tail gpP-like protein